MSNKAESNGPREKLVCQLCGEPMPPGEEMFNYHGYSGLCPKEPAKIMSHPAESNGPRTWLVKRDSEDIEWLLVKANAPDYYPTGKIALVEKSAYDAMKERAEDAVTALRKANEQFKSENPIAGLNTVGDFLKKLDDAAKEKS